ncbi:MAG: diaminopimelate epimerase [Oligoflexia bacterium]|nr:diaminopimelate epimerase [Oligoflexia bacterium]
MNKKTTTSKTKTESSPGLHFTKMTGTGNDFIIFDAREKTFPKFDRKLLAQSLCRRHFSVGADGIIFIEKSKKAHVAFKWDFYNADGSPADMCGNAARCVARYALEKNISDRTTSFETVAGVVNARVKPNGMVEVEMPKPAILEKFLQVPVGSASLDIFYVNTGVPHVVKQTDDWEGDYLKEMGSYLRNHELFEKTNGANVTFYEVIGEKTIQSATYERGVEGITLACGTGAVAAVAAAVLGGMKGSVEVKVPGGMLHVDTDSDLSFATLAGEARFICEGEIKPEALL